MATSPVPHPYCGVGAACKPKCDTPPYCNECLTDGLLDLPYYDMCTLMGRFRHFLAITCPMKAFQSEHDIDHSSNMVFNFKHKRLRECVTEEDLWHHQYVTYANTHPDTRECYHPMTRWPHQVLVNTLLATGMLTFYKTYPGLAFWQWAYQSYQAYISWNHRKSPSCISDRQVFNSYIIGTAGSIGTAFGLKYFAQLHPKRVPRFAHKFIPLAALFVGNLLAIPALRAQELKYGMPVYDPFGRRLGFSVLAAQSDTTERIIVKNAIFALPLFLTPFLTQPFRRHNHYWICKFPFLRRLIMLSMLGGIFVFSTPFALALFKCPGDMLYCDLEQCVRNRIESRTDSNVPSAVFYKSDC